MFSEDLSPLDYYVTQQSFARRSRFDIYMMSKQHDVPEKPKDKIITPSIKSYHFTNKVTKDGQQKCEKIQCIFFS